MADEPEPEVLSQERIFTGRIFNLDRVQLKMPGGSTIQREIVNHPGSVGILPITEDGRILLVRQYRAPARSVLLELPAGTLEEGEAPEECARRELIEEVGQAAASIRRIAGFYLAPGWANEYMHGFVATGLSPQTAPGDDDEEIELAMLTPGEALAAIFKGEIVDCKSIALIGLYLAEQNAGGRSSPLQDENPDAE